MLWKSSEKTNGNLEEELGGFRGAAAALGRR
jgi:hypothetical protein